VFTFDTRTKWSATGSSAHFLRVRRDSVGRPRTDAVSYLKAPFLDRRWGP
jgi:hypothetical protein